MTAPVPAERVVDLHPIKASVGCAAHLPGEALCGSHQTVQLHPYRGRLCSDHAVIPTIPPGPYRREFALEIADLGRVHLALRYLAAHLARECDERFGAASERVGAA